MTKGRFFCGVDAGAFSTKVVVINHDGLILSRHLSKTKGAAQDAARSGIEAALCEAGLDRKKVARLTATGRDGRDLDVADDVRSEADCHGIGSFFYYPRAVTVVDIGRRNINIIRLDEGGRSLNAEENLESPALSRVVARPGEAELRSLVHRVLRITQLEGEIVLTGGVVAHNGVLADLMSAALGRQVLVPLLPQLTAAFGAALLAGKIDVIELTKRYMRE